MATNLALDPELLERAFLLSGEATKKAAVTRALQEYIARREQQRVTELFGTLDWDEGFDYKREPRSAARYGRCAVDPAEPAAWSAAADV